MDLGLGGMCGESVKCRLHCFRSEAPLLTVDLIVPMGLLSNYLS